MSKGYKMAVRQLQSATGFAIIVYNACKCWTRQGSKHVITNPAAVAGLFLCSFPDYE